jgi:flagellar L-ring protein precursor FlgH
MAESKVTKPCSSPSDRSAGRTPATPETGSLRGAGPAPASGETSRPAGNLRLRLLGGALVLCLVSGGALRGDSLWKDDTAPSMFADKRAHKVGDILTIIVQESQAASKEATTKTSRKSSVDAAINTFLYSPQASGLLTKQGKLPAMAFANKNDFQGGGQVNNSEKITTRVAVRVVDTLPNGNLVIEGRRETAFSGERQEAILRGTVRSTDVMANNTVFSYNIADATIQFVSKGPITGAQKKGWFTRLWDKLSPF